MPLANPVFSSSKPLQTLIIILVLAVTIVIKAVINPHHHSCGNNCHHHRNSHVARLSQLVFCQIWRSCHTQDIYVTFPHCESPRKLTKKVKGKLLVKRDWADMFGIIKHLCPVKRQACTACGLSSPANFLQICLGPSSICGLSRGMKWYMIYCQYCQFYWSVMLPSLPKRKPTCDIWRERKRARQEEDWPALCLGPSGHQASAPCVLSKAVLCPSQEETPHATPIFQFCSSTQETERYCANKNHYKTLVVAWSYFKIHWYRKWMTTFVRNWLLRKVNDTGWLQGHSSLYLRQSGEADVKITSAARQNLVQIQLSWTLESSW